MKVSAITFVVTAALFAGACVSTSTHKATLDTLDAAYVEITRLQSELATSQTTGRELSSQLEICSAELSDVKGQLTNSLEANLRCEELLSDTRLLLEQTTAEAEDLLAKLEQLNAIEEETRQRNAIYEDFVNRFQGMIDAGQLEVVIERGRIVLKLPQDVLFESGKAKINEVGTQALLQIAAVLSNLDDRKFQVEGHTDNVPISTPKFPSNWELSSARAQAVVDLFVGAAVLPANLSVAGYSEFQPRATNDTKEGRQLNRRIEIVMLPNLDILSSDIPTK